MQTASATDTEQPPLTVAALDPAVDHVCGSADGHVILEYGDYECPYSRAAFRGIQVVGRRVGTRFAFRHFPLTAIHPRALAAATAAEAAGLQGRFWEMTEMLFARQRQLGDRHLRDYAAELGLDVAKFDVDRMDPKTLVRIRRDVKSGLASRQVRGVPTLFVGGRLYTGPYDARSMSLAIQT